MNLKTGLAALLLLILISGFASRAQAQQKEAPPFSWLEGSWVMKKGNSEFREHWTRISDSGLTGYGFMISKGDTVMRETLRIEKIGQHWVYISAVNKNDPALFTLKESENNTYIFENKEHDFPQLIGYRLQPDGSLQAWIEGKIDGKTSKQEFPMTRIKK